MVNTEQKSKVYVELKPISTFIDKSSEIFLK